MVERKTENPVVKFPKVEELLEGLGLTHVWDAHCHITSDVDEFTAVSRRFSIEAVCTMPSWKVPNALDFSAQIPNDFTDSDSYLKALREVPKILGNGRWSGRIYAFIPVDFGRTPDEFANLLDSMGAAGAKLHPLQDFPIDRSYLSPYIEQLISRGLPLYVHTDWVPSTEWKKVKNRMGETFDKIVKWFSDCTIIMGHAGNNDSYINVWKYLKKYPNVYIETSLSPAPQEIEKVSRHGGWERVLFGSNTPFASAAVELMKVFKMNYFSDEQKRGILYENAAALFKGKPHITI